MYLGLFKSLQQYLFLNLLIHAESPLCLRHATVKQGREVGVNRGEIRKESKAVIGSEK